MYVININVFGGAPRFVGVPFLYNRKVRPII